MVYVVDGPLPYPLKCQHFLAAQPTSCVTRVWCRCCPLLIDYQRMSVRSAFVNPHERRCPLSQTGCRTLAPRADGHRVYDVEALPEMVAVEPPHLERSGSSRLFLLFVCFSCCVCGTTLFGVLLLLPADIRAFGREHDHVRHTNQLLDRISELHIRDEQVDISSINLLFPNWRTHNDTMDVENVIRDLIVVIYELTRRVAL